MISIEPKLNPEHLEYLQKFNATRRVRRDSTITEEREDRTRLAVGLPVGLNGCYFVGETGLSGQNKGGDVLDVNSPPADQPSVWCPWTVREDHLHEHHICLNEKERHNDVWEWFWYVKGHFLDLWGYRLVSGRVDYEESDGTKLRISINSGFIQRFIEEKRWVQCCE